MEKSSSATNSDMKVLATASMDMPAAAISSSATYSAGRWTPSASRVTRAA